MNPYHLSVHYSEPENRNPIHADDVAAKYGFAGGLVPGVYVYAWMTVPVAQRWGMDWVEHGAMHVKLVSPFYDGDEAEMLANPAEDGSLTLTADSGARRCAVGTAALPAVRSAMPRLDDYPVMPLPTHRPSATKAALGEALGSIEITYSASSAAEYEGLVHEPLPLYRDRGIVHPADIVRLGNEILNSNVVLGPWIHTETFATHLGVVNIGETVQARARVKRTFERKGHELVELDMLCVATGGRQPDRPVMHLAHTAIFRMGEPATP